MSGFCEPRPDVVTPNPGGSDDPLGESVTDLQGPWLRVFEPTAVRLVIGRHQDPARELLLAHAVADGVPIHRRICGGGAVVLAPGMLVVAVRLRRDHLGTTTYSDRVTAAMTEVIAMAAGATPEPAGLGDLALPVDGQPCKILGSSLRQSGAMALYLGALLVDDAVALMERYLAHPSREPAYRGGRTHRAFCTHLGRWGVRAASLRPALEAALARALQSWALMPPT